MSIASEITSIGENLKKDYQAIANLGADLTNVDKNIENIAELLDGVYDNLPKTEYAEGTEVNLGVTSKGKLDYDNGVVGIGNTYQYSTTGKNLFGFGVSATDVTTTYRPVANQRLDVTGIGLNEIKFNYRAGNYSRAYFEIDGIDGTSDYSISFNVKENTTSYIPRVEKDTTNSTSNKLIFYISGGNGTTAVDFSEYFILSNIMVSRTEGDYEPYTNGASPNPSYPQTINSVTGNQDVVVSGKNLTNLPNFNFETRGMTNVANNQVINSSGTPVGSWFNISPADNRISQVLKANTKYVFWRNQDLSLPLTARFYYADSTYLNVTISANSHYATFTPTQDTVNYYLYVGSGATADVPLTISNLKIMIYKGETDSANWEPYITPTSYQLSLGEYEFNGIGDYKDELIYDVDEDKVYKKANIKSAILNSTNQTWETQNTNVTTKKRYSTNAFADEIVAPSISSNLGILMCNYYGNQVAGTAGSYGGNQGISISSNGSIYVNDSRYDNDIDGWKTWLNSVICKVYYALQTPVEIPITDTNLHNQVKALYNAHSNNGTTIITSNGNLPMIIKVRGLKGE